MMAAGHGTAVKAVCLRTPQAQHIADQHNALALVKLAPAGAGLTLCGMAMQARMSATELCAAASMWT